MKIIKPDTPEVYIDLFLQLLTLVINKHWVIYTAPIEIYLIISAISRFCVIKYAWRRIIMGDGRPVVKEYGKDSNYPEESL